MRKAPDSNLEGPEIDDRPYICDKKAMSYEEFKTRIANSTTLVIGADMKTYGDYSKWEKIDRNYIGIRDWDNTWMTYNHNKLIDWNDEYPEEKYHGNIPTKRFAELVRSVLKQKKFTLIIVDGGTIQYIHDMETLFNLARDYMDPDGLLIYPVTQQTKTFPTGQSLLDKDTNSFCCYNFEHRDIPKLMKNKLDLVKFVNVTFNHLGLCYVMKYKEGGGLYRDSKYDDLFRLRQSKNQSSVFMVTVDQTRIIRENEFNKWRKIRDELLIKISSDNHIISPEERQTIASCPPKDINNDDINSCLKASYYDYQGKLSEEIEYKIRDEIKQEKEEYDKVFKEIIPEISQDNIIEFTKTKDEKIESDTITLFTLISKYESEQDRIKLFLEKAGLPPDYGSGGNSERCISSASGQGSPAPSPPVSPPVSPRALPPSPDPASPSSFNRKSRRKPVGKSPGKPLRKSVRKSKRKSPRKPLRKSVRKSKRKSPRKPLRKSLRKSKRKSVRKSVRKSLRKSKRKSVRKPLRTSVRKSKRKSRR